VLGILLAYKGAGIWALIAYYFSSTVFSCVALLDVTKWRPQIAFSVVRAKELYSYGWKILVSSLLTSLYKDIRSLLIVKRYSSADLGYYNRAQQFPDIISSLLDTTIQSVMFPVFSSVQEQQQQLRQILKRTIATGALLITPAMMGVYAAAPAMIRVLLTDKWLPCVPIMQAICVAQIAVPLASSNVFALQALGHSDVAVKLEGKRRIVLLGILFATIVIFDSVQAIAISFAVGAWLDAVVVIHTTKRYLGYGFLSQMWDIKKILLASGVMCVFVLWLGSLGLSAQATLAVQIAGGVVAYGGLCILLREETAFFAVNMFFGVRKKRKEKEEKDNEEGA